VRVGRTSVQIWSPRRIAEELLAVVAASAQSLHRPAQISASPLAHRRAAARRTNEARRTTGRARLIKFYASTHADQHISCDAGVVALRCLIVDDQPAFCEAARDLLEGQGLTVVGYATSSAEALRSVRELRPEVALVDIDLAADSGFDLARRLVEDVDGDAPRVILVSTHDEREFVKLIESSPAVGFLAKTELSAERIYRLLEQAGG
jgi:two-component system, NarL family, nitrate/nitrite response regulator NarL